MSTLFQIGADFEEDFGIECEDDSGNDINVWDVKDEDMERIFQERKPEGIERGDVVHFSCFSDYRNMGKMMFDGEKLVHLDTEIDDYGVVPKEFTLAEFEPDHWQETIAHNNYVFLGL